MTLNESNTMFRQTACIVGNYDEMSKSEIVNGYCDAIDAGDQNLADGYYAAIMLRYWYKLFEWRENSSSLHLQDEDFIGWLHDAIWYAVTHRAWRDPTKSIYNDPDGPDKAIQACCGSMRGMAYQYYNKDKRRTNVQTYSIEASQDENGDSALAYTGAVTVDPNANNGAKSIIEYYLQRGKYIEALIVDGIINFDSTKQVKVNDSYESYDEETGESQTVEFTRTTEEFNERKLVKHLTTIDQQFLNTYFCKEYDVSEEIAKDMLGKLKSLTNTKLYKAIEKTKIEIKTTPVLLSMLIG